MGPSQAEFFGEKGCGKRSIAKCRRVRAESEGHSWLHYSVSHIPRPVDVVPGERTEQKSQDLVWKQTNGEGMCCLPSPTADTWLLELLRNCKNYSLILIFMIFLKMS